MPQTSVQPPAAPPPAIAPIPPAPGETEATVISTPVTPITTAEQVREIRAQRSELSNQLISAEGRRSRLVRELEDASEQSRPGLQQRLAVLDERIVQLEQDMAATGRQLTSAPSGLVRTSQSPLFSDGMSTNQITGISIVFIIFVMAPLAIALARRLTRSAIVPKAPRDYFNDSTERMERLEQAVDTIAIEVERISEGQRFLTRVLGDGAAVPLIQAEKAQGERVASGVARGSPGQG